MATSRTFVLGMQSPIQVQADYSQALLDRLPTVRNRWTYWTQERTLNGGQKDVRTRTTLLTDKQLLKLYHSPTEFIGLPLGERIPFFIIDIDTNTRYHNSDDVARLVKLLETRRIIIHVCQSSISGGYHLLCVFSRPVKASKVAKFLSAFLRRHGFNTFGGGLEVWPSESKKNIPVRLPFQAQEGFYLLDPYNDLQPYWWPKSPEDRVKTFLALEQTNPKEVNWKLPRVKEELVNTAGRDMDKFELGKRYFQEGLTGPHQRQEALEAISHYLFYSGYGYDRKEERYQLMVDWMREHHNGHSNEWNKNPQSVIQKIHAIANWERPGRKPLTGNALKWADHNAADTAHCKLLIASAIENLRRTGKLWKKRSRTINKTAIARVAGVDPRTVTAHFDFVLEEVRKPLLMQ